MFGLTLFSVLLSFIGVGVGIVFGFLPGLSATMGVALLMPFTFGMSMENAMSLLLGVYCGGIYGGSITAILIRTPGTPASAATVVDGYPMTQRGEGKKALSAATIGSTMGGLLSCIVLILLARVVANVALQFGAQEYFAVGIFGLSMVTALSGKNIRKGIIAALFGFMLATIGMDPLSGATRFTFGNTYLMAGLETVTALVGLFAISEIFKKIENSRMPKVKEEVSDYVGRGMSFVEMLTKHVVNVIRSSIIGTAIGIIPATGGGTASWMSYNFAKSSAKKDDVPFGEGNVDGVIASETANNAVTGGALVPLLALGIPGDTVTAVLLGALMLQGVTPGPMLFVEHVTTVNAIYILMIISNIFMCFFGLLGVRMFLKVLNVPESALNVCVLGLCFIGAYACRGYSFDMLIALVLGIVGYLFTKADFPIPPVLLGLLLGKTVESNFRRAMTQTGGDWTTFFTRPIACILLIISVIAFLVPIIRKARANAKAKQESIA